MTMGSKRVQRRLARNKVKAQEQAVTATRAVGYLRVSTEEQAQHGYGLEAQERAVRAFAESQGYDLLALHSDAGISGSTRPVERPGFRLALDMAADRGVSVLLVYKFDRLARDIRHAVTTVAELGELHGVALRSVTESAIDTTTPAGRMMFAIFAGMAEQERHTITERTSSGRLLKATKGGIACGYAPYGYRRDHDGHLKVIPQEAVTVRRIFTERQTGRILKDITAGLNADRIPAPKGERWNISTVARILDNPKYSGSLEYLFGETHVFRQGTHTAIV